MSSAGLRGYRVPPCELAPAPEQASGDSAHAPASETATPGAAILATAQPAGTAAASQQLPHAQQQLSSAAQQQPKTEPQTPALVNGSLGQQPTHPQQAASPEQQSAAAPQPLPLANQQRQAQGPAAVSGTLPSQQQSNAQPAMDPELAHQQPPDPSVAQLQGPPGAAADTAAALDRLLSTRQSGALGGSEAADAAQQAAGAPETSLSA